MHLQANRRTMTHTSDEGFHVHTGDPQMLLRSIRAALVDMREEVIDGGRDVIEGRCADRVDFEAKLRRASEAEAHWNEYCRKQSGAVVGDVDFDAIRQAIANHLPASQESY